MGVASLLRVLPTAALAASALRGHDLLGGGAGAGDALAADAGAVARRLLAENGNGLGTGARPRGYAGCSFKAQLMVALLAATLGPP